MIKNFKNGEEITEICYEVVFDDGKYNGFGFPCDENGNVKKMANEIAQENYEYCLKHPEKFARYNKVIKEKHVYRENNTGTCECGEEIELVDQYLGACECPNCGRWYNMWGQELNNPNTWSDGDDW